MTRATRAAWVAAVAIALGAATAGAQRPRLPFPMRGASADPTPAEREYTAGEVLLRGGDVTGAEARFVAAQGLDPRDARPVFYLGEVARARAETVRAERQRHRLVRSLVREPRLPLPRTHTRPVGHVST